PPTAFGTRAQDAAGTIGALLALASGLPIERGVPPLPAKGVDARVAETSLAAALPQAFARSVRECCCAQLRGRVGALPLSGLAILEACCFVGAAGRVASAVRMSAGARERAAIDDQVFLAYRTTIKPALQDLAHSGRIAGLRGQRRPRNVWRHP